MSISMDDEGYRIGVQVGHVMAALTMGSRGISATWSENTPEQASREVENLAKFCGLDVKFGERSIDISEPEIKRAKLSIVPTLPQDREAKP